MFLFDGLGRLKKWIAEEYRSEKNTPVVSTKEFAYRLICQFSFDSKNQSANNFSTSMGKVVQGRNGLKWIFLPYRYAAFKRFLDAKRQLNRVD